MNRTIFVISGLADIDTSTNQTMKNTIKYLSKFGFDVHVFAAFPTTYPTLQDPGSVFGPGVRFHRSPALLGPVFLLAKKVKDSLGRIGARKPDLEAATAVGYHDEYNLFGRLLFALFLFLYAPLEIPRVTFYFLRHRPALFYGINGPGSALASVFGWLFRRPVVHRWTGSAYTPEEAAELRASPWKRMLMLDGAFALTARSDAIVMTDDGTRGDEVLKVLGVEPRKIHFWKNGLDLDDLALPPEWDPDAFRAEQGLQGKAILLMVSRLVLWKRVDRGVRCVHELRRRFGRDVHLLVAGDGSERPALEALAADLGAGGSVRFLGSVPHTGIGSYYSIADVFLSLYDVSNLGNPVLEAMHFGLPIVSVDDGSTGGLLSDGVNCCLVSPKELDEEVPARVHGLLADRSGARALGARARATLERQVLSWERRMELERELIDGLIASGGRPA